MASTDFTFVRDKMVEPSPPPPTSVGVIGWVRQNLFSGITNTVLTLFGVYIIYLIIPPILDFALLNAVWEGENREACKDVHGACWPYIGAYFKTFMYGRYPDPERWRVNIVAIMFVIGLVPMLIPSAPFKRETIIYLFVVFPVAALILLTGGDFTYGGFFLPMEPGETRFWIEFLLLAVVVTGVVFWLASATGGNPKPAVISVAVIFAVLALIFIVASIDFGLEVVETSVWGGLLVTMVIAVTGIAASLPIGIALALGRRSKLPIVRLISVIFIEFWRGVPLITVLFMSSVMLPLFLPEGMTFDKLLRALIGVALFASAYMAEVVRGGLQAIPKGQYEGAMALGLRYWQMMFKIILPQALKLVIPGIVNTFIGLFKDTTLVLIIGLFDLLGMIQSSFTDPTWSSPTQSHTGYMVAAMIFWVFCFGMSRYSIFMENLLNTGHKR